MSEHKAMTVEAVIAATVRALGYTLSIVEVSNYYICVTIYDPCGAAVVIHYIFRSDLRTTHILSGTSVREHILRHTGINLWVLEKAYLNESQKTLD